jgi:Domain of unknown function (DUF6458)
MSIGASIFLLVVGAILTFAVSVSTEGFNINTVGIILMIAGVIGLLLSLLFWSSFSPYRRRPTAYPEERVVEERRPTAYPEERVVEERRIERDYP